MARAYLWIAACAGCNSIFGLDDNSQFLAPDAPVDASLQNCFTETFDLRDPEIWEDLAAPTHITHQFEGGLFQAQVMGPITDTLAGIVTKRSFDLTGGSVEITVVDGSNVEAEAGMLLLLDDRNTIGFATRSERLQASYAMPTIASAQSLDTTDTQLRIRHDAETGSVSWESAPVPGAAYSDPTFPVVVIRPRSVKIAVYAMQRLDSAEDTITLDNLVVTARCP